MCLGSDIDFLILQRDENLSPYSHSYSPSSVVTSALEALELGKPSEFGSGAAGYFDRLAQHSFTVRLALTDCSYVVGNQDLVKELKNALAERFGLRDEDDETTLLNLLFVYRRFYSYGSYKDAEPHIKKGRGGLRDLQFLHHYAAVKHDTLPVYSINGSINTLCSYGLLSKSQGNDLKDALTFILQLRNEMHWQFGESQDVLNSHAIKKIAPSMGVSAAELLNRYRNHAEQVYKNVDAIKRHIRLEIEKARGQVWANLLREAEDSKLCQQRALAYARMSDPAIRTALAWHSKDPRVLEKILETEYRTGHADWNVMIALANNPVTKQAKPLPRFALTELAGTGLDSRRISREIGMGKESSLDLY